MPCLARSQPPVVLLDHGTLLLHVCLLPMQVLDKFRQDPGTVVLLGSLLACGTGITVTCASEVVLMEPYWNPFVSLPELFCTPAQAWQKATSINTMYESHAATFKHAVLLVVQGCGTHVCIYYKLCTITDRLWCMVYNAKLCCIVT